MLANPALAHLYPLIEASHLSVLLSEQSDMGGWDEASGVTVHTKAEADNPLVVSRSNKAAKLRIVGGTTNQLLKYSAAAK